MTCAKPANDHSIIPFGVGSAEAGQALTSYNTLVLEYLNLANSAKKSNVALKTLDDQLEVVRKNVRQAVDQTIDRINKQIDLMAKRENAAQSKLGTIPAKERQFLELSRQQSIKNELPDIRPHYVTEEQKYKYTPYVRDPESQVRYWAIPGQEGYTHVLLLDCDTTFPEGAWEVYLSHLSDEEIMGPSLLLADGRPFSPCYVGGWKVKGVHLPEGQLFNAAIPGFFKQMIQPCLCAV